MSTLFQALQAEKNADDVSVHVKTISTEDLPKDGVLIKVAYSGINYKDGLTRKSRRQYRQRVSAYFRH